MIDTPKTLKGVVVSVGIVVAILLFLFTTNLLAFVVGVALVAIVLYVAYIVGIRGHRYLLGEYSRRGGL